MQRRLPLGESQIDSQNDLWITSYADLISAILAVLVLFVSFSKIDVEKMDTVMRVMNNEQQCPTLSDIKQQIATSASIDKVDKHLNMSIDNEGLTISYDSAALFDSGSAELKKSLLTPFDSVMKIVADVGHQRYIDIAGHTDDVKPKTGSNWSLSAQRALAMQEYLKKFGLPNEGLRLTAYADTLPKTDINGLKGELKEKARRDNRRVNILIRTLKKDVNC